MTEQGIGWVLRIGVFVVAILAMIAILLGFWSSQVAFFITKEEIHLISRTSLLLLVYLQLLRVVLTMWLFEERQQWLFFGCSMVILAGLAYSMFWQALH